MTSLPQSRRWVFTSFKDALEISTNGVKYYVYQAEEAPTTKKKHWQGYIVLTRAQRMSFVKKCLDDEKAHIEIANGTDEQCIAYCTKPESQIAPPIEWGDKPAAKTSQGKRTDLHSVVKTIQETKAKNISWIDLAEKYPAVMARYNKFVEKYCAARGLRLTGDSALTRVDMTYISIIYGKTGSGKTTHVKTLPDAYWKNQDNKWWDGYTGQENVIINEWTCPETMNMLALLRLADHAPLKLEVKGGMVDFLAKHVYITTNIEIDTIKLWMEKLGEQGKALERRITFYTMVEYKCVKV